MILTISSKRKLLGNFELQGNIRQKQMQNARPNESLLWRKRRTNAEPKQKD
jgi:hypothetical protein